MSWVYLALIFTAVITNAQGIPPPFDVRIDHYKVETIKDLVINTPRPRLSWKLPNFAERNVQQTAYQIQLKFEIDEWDSGRIDSSRSIHVPCTDKNDLKPSTNYQIRLRIWTTLSNQASLWTEWIQFRTSVFNLHAYIMQLNDQVNWIGSTQIYMNELRKEFNVSSDSPIRTATAYVSGIGYYELYVNGNSTDLSRKLDPGWTTYEKRTLLVSYDLTTTIKAGMNAVGVKLGNGWYSQEQYVPPSASEPNYGPPRLLFVLHIIFENSDDMAIYSDQTWKGRQGSIVHDSVYNGEIVDNRYDRPGWAQVGFNDSLSLWITPEIMPPPVNITANGQMTLQDMPPIRAGPDALHFEIENPSEMKNSYLSKEDFNDIQGARLHDGGILKPISVSTPVLGVHTFDMGQNMVGWCRFHFRGPRGLGIYIRHAEILAQPVVSTHQAYGSIDTQNLRGATQADSYILRGDPNGEIYEPRFTVHGFRFITVFGSPNSLSVNDVECLVVHSETTVKGHFVSTNPIINQIQHNVQWGQLGNSMSLPTDCPQRDERKGWMGDAALTVNEALYNFDLIKFYLNFLNLIGDIQLGDGSIADTVPVTFGGYPADPNWGTALPTITWQLYRHYNDLSIIRDHYSHVRAYVESVRGGYNRTGLARLAYHYGDWVPPPPQRMTNVYLIASYGFLHDVSLLVNMSQAIGFTNDTQAYSAFYLQLAEEFHRVFFTASAGYYADGMQAAQILALALPNVVPVNVRDSVLQHLIQDINSKGNHTSTGIVSTAALYPLLSDNGQHDLAVELVSTITYPSYGYMFNNPYENATTMWELWDAPMEGPGMNSRNHHMFSSIGAWFYSHLAGIDFQSDLILIHPRMLSENKKHLLTKIDCQLSTLYGLVHVSYTRDERDTFANSILLRVSIPSNARAQVIFEPLYPGARCVTIMENHEVIWSIDSKDNSVFHDVNTGLMTRQVGSGDYEYQAFWE
ncbi:unnamed protein product [Rotaria socialis]|uniref:alpha-L-rhamnosidase n=1 Tax=Rotaria socialis TaxID=392032 RepID=A0A819YKS7_9BILA|nr:unnamed protein product [Rotaria socialis]CAF3585332.1 unnamed protein product [Rotaria socialis]CAF3751557.1 unnamed protein product [Rotaria socialis]CAF4158455.1 unnamed protein product [Rotaria socialis]CAF4307345.1 unnamed protein product [Rotaria socialis]